jgi:predicted ATPase/class 3 adenylate cyclase/Tfp pilus assembly protein PilF
LDQRLYDLLRHATVRLGLASSRSHGTGFFVAPGLILTCAHVVEQAASLDDDSIQVSWSYGEAEAHIEQFSPSVDLALLRVKLPEHPCVYLHESFEPKDQLFSYGYPANHPKGDSVTAEAEGWSQFEDSGSELQFLKFKAGQVLPGLSGAPLLNLRTGGVCGVVKRTRDKNDDLGGFAVPASLILSEFRPLVQQQREFHRRHPAWADLLPTLQKALELPSGTVTFLFTDIEGSTRLWEQYSAEMSSALGRHDALLRRAIVANGGAVFKLVGDAFCAAFATAPASLAAALAAQRALQSEPWGELGQLRVRMALHTGVAVERDNDYFGPTVNRVARLLAIGHGGQTLLSLATEQLLRGSRPEGVSLKSLGLHRLKDLDQPEQVFQLLHPDLPAAFPPLKSLDFPRHNLSAQLTSFIGRERELAEVQRLLSMTRLLTLTGIGGGGKTRLARQLAADVLEQYADGVWFVELAAIAIDAQPELVYQAVTTTLGVREEPGHSILAPMSDYLQTRKLLLILDNCEHLVEVCAPLVETLLLRCPDLKIITTSRERLRAGGELTYQVPPLDRPDPRRLPLTTADLSSAMGAYDAVRLFLERAVFSLPGFEVSSEEAPTLAKICWRLDGIPLAIELAAARVNELTLEQIASLLEDRFELLAEGRRTPLARHQTLRAAIDWSYDLLVEAERVLLRRLSVFTGGWTLEAATYICLDEGQTKHRALTLLSKLVNKSLVEGAGTSAQPGVEGRYRFLETIREYSWDRLEGSGEIDGVHRRHRDWYLMLVEQAQPNLIGANQNVWLNRLETEHDNLRAALEWTVNQGEAEAALRLAGALWRFWHVRGHWREGRDRLQVVLGLPNVSVYGTAQARALNAAGALAHNQADLSAAAALHEEALSVARKCNDPEAIADAFNHLGNVALDQGDDERATTLYQQSLALCRELGNRQKVALLLSNLGAVALDRGQYDDAVSLHQESLTHYRELGDPEGIARTLNNLGAAAIRQGHHVQAYDLLDESLHLFQQLNNSYGTAMALDNLADLAFDQGDLARAAMWHGKSLKLSCELGNRQAIVESLEGIAALVAERRHPLQAAKLYGAAEALRESAHLPLPKSERDLYNVRVAAARAGTEEPAWRAAWIEGQQMSLQAVIVFAEGQASAQQNLKPLE